MPNEVNVTLRGPIFQGKAPPTINRAGQRTVQTLVELGESRLAQMLRPRPSGVFLSVAQAERGKASVGHYRSNVNGVVSGLAGVITDGGVVYGPWLEGVSSRNQRTRFKGYASFRRTGQWLNQQVGKVLRRHMQQAIRDIGGASAV